MEIVTAHYHGYILRQAYRVVGSAAIFGVVPGSEWCGMLLSLVLGNPLGLAVDLKTGVRDAFYEPAVAIHEGPEAFTLGERFTRAPYWLSKRLLGRPG